MCIHFSLVIFLLGIVTFSRIFILNTVLEVIIYKVRCGSVLEIDCNVDPGFV
jgi:hypothetical protein